MLVIPYGTHVVTVAVVGVGDDADFVVADVAAVAAVAAAAAAAAAAACRLRC